MLSRLFLTSPLWAAYFFVSAQQNHLLNEC